MSASTHDALATAVASPHIPDPKGSPIHDWSFGSFDLFGSHIDLHITNTVFTTWIFMVLLFAGVASLYLAIKTDKLPRIKSF